jgi:hypothetical protein
MLFVGIPEYTFIPYRSHTFFTTYMYTSKGSKDISIRLIDSLIASCEAAHVPAPWVSRIPALFPCAKNARRTP